MYRRRFFFYLLLPLLALAFCGCSLVLERDFSSEIPHVTADNEDDGGSGVLELTSYEELKDALQLYIQDRTSMQTVRLTDYSGDVERDVQHVVRDVMATPLGAFAVTNIAYQSSRILSYYEIRFDISYRRTAQEIENIEQIDDADELGRFLRGKLAQFSTGIIFQLSDYSEQRYDLEKIFMNAYYSDPKLAYGFRSLETNLYPESGSARIVEFTVSYAQQPVTLSAKSATATDEAQIILDSYIGSNLTVNRLKYFYDTLCSSVDFDAETAQALQDSEKALPKTDPFTVYGAIIKKKAVGEGFALAFKQLCDMSDIDCVVVSGKLNGAPHMWNMVINRGEWSHIDCSVDIASGGVPSYEHFGRTDEEMGEHYTWDKSAYPESTSHILREMLSLDVPADAVVQHEDGSEDGADVPTGADAADVAPDAENPLDGTPEDGDDGSQEAEPPEIGSSDTEDGGDSGE